MTFILPRHFPVALIIFAGGAGRGTPPPSLKGDAGNPPLPRKAGRGGEPPLPWHQDDLK